MAKINESITIELPPSFVLSDPTCECGWSLADAQAEPGCHAQRHCAVCGELAWPTTKRVDKRLVTELVCTNVECGHAVEWVPVLAEPQPQPRSSKSKAA